MKLKTLCLFVTCLSLALFVLGCAGGPPAIDFGDSSSGNLLWGATHHTFGDVDLDKAVAFADKNLEVHGAEARRLQASLSDFPVTDPPDNVFKYNALNNVAMSVLAKGEALWRKGDLDGAAAAYKMVISEFGYAQAQDLGEWVNFVKDVPRDPRGFIKIADVAKQRLADLAKGEMSK